MQALQNIPCRITFIETSGNTSDGKQVGCCTGMRGWEERAMSHKRQEEISGDEAGDHCLNYEGDLPK